MKKQSVAKPIVSALVVALIFVLAWLAEKTNGSSSMLVTVLKKGAVYALIAVSMNLLNGFTGLFSLGQAGFMLVGAYTYAIFTIPLAKRVAVYQYYAGGCVGVELNFVVALILAGVLAGRMAKRVVEPLNELDLEHPLENDDAYQELTPLLDRLNRQRNQISAQMRELKRRTDEFAQITQNLQEGLVLLDHSGHVLSINPAARRLFAADESCVGQDFLTVERSHEVSAALAAAMAGGRADARIRCGDRVYRLDVSRIESGDIPAGAAILAFDVTEQEDAEKLRREFTANVSHELKTPLQGIIGSAELIENGMVKAEDMPRFIGHIRTEAQRLVALIGDIIRLSQLDEGGEMPREQVDLLEVSREAAEELRAAASKKNIGISVDGEHVSLRGVRRLIFEAVYNLCDNAVKYNVEGGSVSIRTGTDGVFACVAVRDTGIGIAPEHQGRVFERFYRVDKSHSKASGGTGLGLSIVKHAVQYHHGRIELDSAPGRGTEIRIYFPL